ncbi:Ascochitine biosynthesis cluster transcriptional regulator [Elasticomyces elasticus]|nr:Ascochitine biosynthesis cluster transcriptional regulator [Elasticomyces elasticus]
MSTSIRLLEFLDPSAVVRTAPSELSFATAQSWKDIYGFRPGHKTFIKSDFYDGGSFAGLTHSIVSERDPVMHGMMRKYLSHAFSDRALTEQEALVAKTIDKFVVQIGKTGDKGLDIGQGFVMMTFDIIGDLAFGETFGGIASGQFAGAHSKVHGTKRGLIQVDRIRGYRLHWVP